MKRSLSLQRAKQEQQEALEFSEAERETLLEANTELESQVKVQLSGSTVCYVAK